MKDLRQGFWSMPAEDVLKNLETSKDGLSNTEAKKRIVTYGYNSIKPKKDNNALDIFISQFKSPIILILFFAVGLSFFLHDTVDAIIILTIILVSGLLSFWQEYNANNAVQKLLEIVQIKATVLRDGKSAEIPVEEIVPGDIVMLKAGAVVPGDSLILESNSLSIDEAILTGETFPTDKEVGVLPFETSLSQRRNCLWMGTHVVSGTAKAVIISTGKTTEFGRISERLKIRPLETEFERGVKHFGYFLMEHSCNE